MTGIAKPCGKCYARKEVIISSGTANTAKLLQMSGVGPACAVGRARRAGGRRSAGGGKFPRSLLGAHRRPGEEHPHHQRNVERARPRRVRSRGGRLGKPSILAVSPSLVHWFWKSEDTMEQPDLQGVFSPASYKQGFVGLLDDYPGMTAGVWQHRPESTGYVRARSTDPFEDPAIQPNYLKDPMDQRALLNGMKLARRLLHTQALAPYLRSRRIAGARRAYRRRMDGLRAAIWIDRVSSDRHRADGTGKRPNLGGERPVAGARIARACGWSMRRSCRTCRRPTPTVRQ